MPLASKNQKMKLSIKFSKLVLEMFDNFIVFIILKKLETSSRLHKSSPFNTK